VTFVGGYLGCEVAIRYRYPSKTVLQNLVTLWVLRDFQWLCNYFPLSILTIKIDSFRNHGKIKCKNRLHHHVEHVRSTKKPSTYIFVNCVGLYYIVLTHCDKKEEGTFSIKESTCKNTIKGVIILIVVSFLSLLLIHD
jgi:hypothetical protein